MLNIEEALEETHDVLKVKVVEIVFFCRERWVVELVEELGM